MRIDIAEAGAGDASMKKMLHGSCAVLLVVHACGATIGAQESAAPASAAKTADPAKQGVSEQKQFALDWLNQRDVRDKFGTMSDSIWSYAELGLQEFKSSALLI
jgi:hypothetical protein